MQVGDLVKHIEYDYIGIVINKDEYNYYIHWTDDDDGCEWYGEHNLELICK